MSIGTPTRFITGSTGTNSSSQAFTVTTTTTVGALLVLTMNSGSLNVNLSSVTDSQGNAWHVDAAYMPSSSTECVGIASCVCSTALVGTTDTITINTTAPTAQWTMQAMQTTSTTGWNGGGYIDISPVLATSGTTNDYTTSTSATVGAATTIHATTIAWGAFSVRTGTSASAFTQGTGYTSFANTKNSGQFPTTAAEYKILSSAGAQTATGTWSIADAASHGLGALVAYYDQDPTNGVASGRTILKDRHSPLLQRA